jgi:aminodeoxyfutalosine deaminase
MLNPELRGWINAMPKAELHVHLEGAIQPETLLELARRHQQTDKLPSTDIAALRQWFTFSGFPHFVQIYFTISGLLQRPEDFAYVVYACGQEMAAQNIRYRELTFTPYTHTHLQQKGLSIADIFAGLEDGRVRAQRDFGVEMRWVFDVPRNTAFPRGIAAEAPLAHYAAQYNPTVAEITLEYALAGRDRGVIGFGLGGFEVGAPPEPFAHAFAAAKAAGLLSVPHAGETMGAASVAGALHTLQADRIGHGVRAVEDPHLLALLKERQIPLEVNPTSNICLHVYRRLAEHPFPHLDKMGLLVTVNSDDPPLFNTDLSSEYGLLASEFGYDQANLARIARNAFLVCAAPPALKQQLLADFDAWVAANAA